MINRIDACLFPERPVDDKRWKIGFMAVPVFSIHPKATDSESATFFILFFSNINVTLLDSKFCFKNTGFGCKQPVFYIIKNMKRSSFCLHALL
jgi:hypothetical protein